MKIVLASGSPRRRELLTQAGIEYIVDPADIEEVTKETMPDKVVEDLSRQKAVAVAAKHTGQIVLAADTVVAYDGKILGKPADEDDAFRMLTELSGRTHQVFTGVTIVDASGDAKTFSECTEVTMYENSPEAIKAYISSGEPMDKAGAYGIQGLGAVLVEKINGDYNNVVGLPLAKVYRVLYNV
ncbi:Maf family protein [Pseudobutyrivibrio xylanivorans]|uniref:dTTP/UTP pyrophosphatase n=1 Tax=Pseudobutyrivibrio xylanivorans TaxID=185007 RepID=A0A5P6VW04_PSEXY|nr:Maf family protein [Pseudobutyrivibrio xylanivorans]QFJ55721.1 septum formation inhibitor Maf [Pseudobutyrivibrio xylanivorans]